jgi:hypothetical protein
MNTPRDEIFKNFRNYIYSLRIAEETFADLTTSLQTASTPRVIIFTGPSGVGKSTLTAAACNRILRYYEPQMCAEPDFVPLVTISAVPPNSSGFSWKDFYIRLLTGQHEPLVDRKLLLPRQSELFPDQALVGRSLERCVSDTLRRSVEEYFRHRRTKFLVVDEAHHMLLVNGRQRLECQFESLKSLTIQTGVTILLVGTYRLLDILEQSGQLTRRSHVVNFRRYDIRDPNDRKGFRMVLAYLEQRMSEIVPTRLSESIKDVEYFYCKCAGCVGILKNWLGHCLEQALEEKASLIDAPYADRFALKNRGVFTIAEEALHGEAKLADVSDARLLDLLNNGVLLGDGESHKTLVKRRIGQRKPKRDPVGKK